MHAFGAVLRDERIPDAYQISEMFAFAWGMVCLGRLVYGLSFRGSFCPLL